MKTKLKITVLLIISLVSCTRIIVKNVEVNKSIDHQNHLLNYFLPKKEIELKFTVERKVIEPSSFLEDSVYLNPLIKSATGKEMVRKKTQKLLLKGLELNSVSLPDPDKLYSISYRKGPFSKLDGTILLSENGFIQSGTVSKESKAFQIVQTGLETIAGTVSSIIGLKKGYSFVESTSAADKSTIMKAKELLKKLSNIQDEKASLITSNMDMGIKLFETKMTILKELEDDLVQQLTGEISQEEFTFTKTWCPKPDDFSTGELNKTFTIEMFVNKSGNEKLSIPIIMVASVDNAVQKLITSLNITTNLKDTELRKIGFYYNIPVAINIKFFKESISDINQLNFIINSKKQSSISLQIPQLGPVNYLPSRLTKSDIKFYPDLGSIKGYSFTKNAAISPEEAKNISTSVDTLFSTEKYLKSLKESVIEEKTIEIDSSASNEVKITETSKKL